MARRKRPDLAERNRGRSTHGHYRGGTETRTHAIWRGIIARCNNPGSKDYPRYGGRGVAVCSDWQIFHRFLADMGEAPAGASIERVDNHGDYEPGNCRWATSKEQSRNRRSNRIVEFRGEALCIAEWAERLGASRQVIRYRLEAGWSIEDALTKPVQRRAK